MPARPGTLSIVIPVYRNEASLPDLLDRLARIHESAGVAIEAIFVVDGSEDRSLEVLDRLLPAQPYPSQLMSHSRNFGSFSAIRSGLERVSSEHFAMMAADLQEPADLVVDMHQVLVRDEADVVVGVRRSRSGDGASRFRSQLFWSLYRAFVNREMPRRGVDIFAGNRQVLTNLLALHESNSSLVGQVFWLGFRRAEVAYDRQPRQHGTSAWNARRRMRYLTDSVYSFTDLPIRLLTAVGSIGIVASVCMGIVVLSARLAGGVHVPGYSATVLTITFFAALNMFGLGIIGAYVWRTFENTKGRPGAIVAWERSFRGRQG